MNIDSKPIEIFCGTGGVGKTTLATSRALNLASVGKTVLLITIDPAKRLKEILGIKEEYAGIPQNIKSQKLHVDQKTSPFSFDAMLMSPAMTLSRIGQDNNCGSSLNNPILNILMRPNGGMNEIMAVIEVQHHLDSKIYDTIILDTPPGKHFIDFLKSTKKIQHFFDQSFIDIFKYLGKSEKPGHPSKGIVSLMVSTGIKKLLSYLGKVTGQSFIETFIDAIIAIYKSKESFTRAMKFQEELSNKNISNWFLVTSVDQQKSSEASDLIDQASLFLNKNKFLILNKSLHAHLKKWDTENDPVLTELKTSMLNRETILKKSMKNKFNSILEFKEILDPSPEKHVHDLSIQWN